MDFIIKTIKIDNKKQINEYINNINIINSLNCNYFHKIENLEISSDYVNYNEKIIQFPLEYFRNQLDMSFINKIYSDINISLEICKSRNIVFGNLKLSNIFLTANGNVVLNDYCKNMIRNCEIIDDNNALIEILNDFIYPSSLYKFIDNNEIFISIITI